MDALAIGFAAAAAIVAMVVTVLLMRASATKSVAETTASLSGEIASARTMAQEVQRQLAVLQRDLMDRTEQLSATRAENAALKQDNKWLVEEIDRQKGAVGSTQHLLERAEYKLREAFQALAAEALNTNRAAFLDLARMSFVGLQKEAAIDMESRRQAIDSVVQPILATLKQVDMRLGEAERERLEAYTRLTEQVTALGSSANTLTKALRTPAVRGRWGEMQLRRVVEIAGMLQRCDFDEQPGLDGETGRLRPDLIVRLPGDKRIVVDAKAPLEAFLDAQEAADDESRALKLQAHARQVRDHMDKLGSKAYWDQLGESPEMVVMFLPGETLFSAALQHDLTLIEHGLQQRVLLASPITLIALLTTVAHTWRQEALAENYREVARLGKSFYDRLSKFAWHFEELRKKLDGAVQVYNEAAGSFEARVLVGARRLKDLGVTTAEEIPAAESVDTVPRVLKQIGLMGLPEGATTDDGTDLDDHVGP
jgi:DNA recombination protein RmuC